MWGLEGGLGVWRANLRSGGQIWCLESWFKVSRAKLRSERAIQPILMAQRAKIRPKRAKLRPPMAKGGGTDGRMDVWKFTPVSYRTSALWGRCPKRYNRQTKRKNLLQNKVSSFKRRSVRRSFVRPVTYTLLSQLFMCIRLFCPIIQKWHKQSKELVFKSVGVNSYLSV